MVPNEEESNLKPRDIRTYAKTISDVVEQTSKNSEDLNGDFEVVRKAIDTDKVSDLSQEKLQAIKDHFQSGTDKYNAMVNTLEKVAVPVKLLGKHKQLVHAYEEYAESCQAMTDSISPDSGVDVNNFNKCESNQDNRVSTFSDTSSRIMINIQ